MELEKQYNPKAVEDGIYDNWVKNKYFHSEVDESKTPYTIVIPPPNITGQLHMGHAWDNTIQDILIRYKRMKGFNALWLPGTDHASISTEVKVAEKILKEEGLTKAQVGREGFLERTWEWKKQYGDTIINQLKKLGCSCDWDRERFTMDEGLKEAVLEVFIRLYSKGLIYRGERIINWCTKCKTTISDAEVSHEDRDDSFWHVRYPFADGSEGYLVVATTRPETMLGDTALAVHPEDERYTNLIGKKVILPLTGREIPIIADEYVEREFGTGVVKITPAHDPNDFEVGVRHNLPRINVLNDDGTMNSNAGEYCGLDRYAARKKMVALLEEQGLLDKVVKIRHAVGVHERCNDVVEPLIKLQWFIKMEELAVPAIDACKSGKLSFVTERFEKVYLNWLENIRDWCISRQLWWGHQIPAYYCETCGHIEVARSMPECCSKCGAKKLRQDEDTLDTWFSSALWPFATLGWPEQTKELKYYYPTDVLVTGFDIIFFWVVRMVFSGIEHMGEVPFKHVFIHGLMRDAEGKKFSKSLGNGVDPLDAIEKFGADALRLTIILGNDPANDMRFYYDKIESGRNFANKLWNASRFVLMNLDGYEHGEYSLEPADKWILSRANTLAKEVSERIDRFDLGIGAQKIYDFIWDEYCDWYIEMVKPRLYNKDDTTRNAALYTLREVLKSALKLMHPFMPFITERIFMALQDKEPTIMLSAYPEYDNVLSFAAEEAEIEIIKDAVRTIRNIRAEMNVPPSKKSKVYIVTGDEKIKSALENGMATFAALSYATEVMIQKDGGGIPEESASGTIPNATIYLPIAELMDIEKELERLRVSMSKLEKEVMRAEQKLSNEGFVKKAPPSVIDEERAKQAKYVSELEQIKERLENLSKINL